MNSRGVSGISRKVRAKLTEAGQTQEWLAKRLGISDRTFSRRNRDGQWTFPQLQKLFRELDFTEQEILQTLKGGRHEI